MEVFTAKLLEREKWRDLVVEEREIDMEVIDLGIFVGMWDSTYMNIHGRREVGLVPKN